MNTIIKKSLYNFDSYSGLVKFSIYVNAWLVEMSKKTDQQQQTLSSQQDEMRQQQGELRDTINRVDLSEENLAKAVEKFNLLKDQYDDLDKDREKLINSMESMNKDFNSIKDQVIGDLKSFNEAELPDAPKETTGIFGSDRFLDFVRKLALIGL